MLRDHFYSILSTDKQSINTCSCQILINKESPVFQGHFPSVPVVPGVCMLQMLKEQLEEKTGRKLQLKKAANIKFLSVINPLQHPLVHMDISFQIASDNSVLAEGSITSGDLVFFKLAKALYH